MDTDRRHGLPHLLHLLVLVSLLALSAGTGAALAAPGSSSAKPAKHGPKLGGTWSGTYGGAYSGTFKLRWTRHGSKLSGTISLSNPNGRYGISGSVHGNRISFGAVGAGATYTGSVTGKTMSGHYKTATGGGSWSARKAA